MNDNTLIHRGYLFSLYKEKVDLADGKHTYFDIVRHPGGAVIGAINDDNEICLLKQWRQAVHKTIWELPAGCLEPNEEPILTAKRELEEEAGVTATDWQALGTILPSAGFSDEELHLFVARNLNSGKINLDDAEQLEALWVPLPKAIEMAKDGTISDAKTLALLFRLL